MIKFGTGGFRAVIADDFTKANLELLAQGLADKMADENVKDSPVVIGYDRRFMSDIAARWCSAVLAANGIPVRLINEDSPTPLIMFTVKKLGSQYGMAVTASHNPAEYNGVKIFTHGGRDASKEVTDELEIATVGIGAGNGCDAQVLVWQDMAGYGTGRTAKFVKKYAALADELRDAAREYGTEVRSRAFPGAEHSF